jgi:PPOX class probable F420-dependent enzyme
MDTGDSRIQIATGLNRCRRYNRKAMSLQPASPNLAGHRYMSLATFRKTGKAVATPVWFAEEDGRIYVYTAPNAGKVKRLRNNPRVELAPCTYSGKVLGPAVEARALILPAGETAAARQALLRKYGWQARLGFFFSGIIRREPPAFLEIAAV